MAGEGRTEAEEFPPGTVVWRRIPPWHFPKKARQHRPDSPAFDDDEDGPMSVVVARADRDPREVLVGHDGFGLVELSLEDLEGVGQQLAADPLPEEADHALVVGNKTDSRKRNMAKAARWVVPPPDLGAEPSDSPESS